MWCWMCAHSLQPWKLPVARASSMQCGCIKRIALCSVGRGPGRLRRVQASRSLATVNEFKGQRGWEAVRSNWEIWCLAHEILPVFDLGWQLSATATGQTSSGLMCTFGCHDYYSQLCVESMFFFLRAIKPQLMFILREVHSTDFTHKVQLTCPEEYFTAYYLMSYCSKITLTRQGWSISRCVMGSRN